MNECPSFERLQSALDDSLPDSLRQEIDDHVDGCSKCQETLERITAFQPRDMTQPPGSGQGRSSRIGSPSSGRGGHRQKFSDIQLLRLRGLLSDPAIGVQATSRPDAVPTVMSDVAAIPGYEVIRELGRGGMAVVYLARHLRLNRPVALKMIRSGEYATPEQLVRFGAEGEIIARLRHPNIVQIYEIGSRNKQPYFALELMAGGSLDAAQDGRPIPARIAVGLIETIARAIDYAHAQGVVHRDLKPANILLAGPGSPPTGHEPTAGPDLLLLESTPKITDFGLAKNVEAGSDLTQTGIAMGTPSYMAPEQVQGRADRIGPASDVYSLGAILYELLTGRPPFLATNSLDILNQVTQLDPVAPSRLLPQVPRDLDVICLKCLEKEPSRRYATACELADDLGRFLRSEPIHARHLPAVARAWRWAVRRPAIAGLLCALAIALGAGFGGSAYFALEARDRARVAILREGDAQRASEAARAAEAKSARISADLLLDRALGLAGKGRAAESLHWMLASLRSSNDPSHQRLVRTHLAGWAARVPTLTTWLDTYGAVAFSPTDPLLAASGVDRRLEVEGRACLQFWDYRKGTPIGGAIRDGDLFGDSLAFSPDGRTLLRANGAIQPYQGIPGWVRRWDVPSRRPLGKTTGPEDAIMCVTWHPDGRRFVTGSFDKTVCVWDSATTQRVAGPWPLPNHVLAVECSGDGRWLLAMTRRAAHLLDLSTGEQVGPALGLDSGFLLRVAFGDDGRELCVGGIDDASKDYRVLVQRWEPASKAFLGPPRIVPHPSGELARLPDGRVAAARGVSHDGSWFFRVDEGVQALRFARDRSTPPDDPPLGPSDSKRATYPTTATFSPDGSTAWILLAGSTQLLGWDVGEARPTGIQLPHAALYYEGLRPSGASTTGLIATMPVIVDDRYTIQVRDGRDGRAIGPPLPHRNIVNVQSFSPDGKLLATGGLIHSAQLWEVATGRPLGRPLPGYNVITDMAFSPNGQTLAIGTFGEAVRIWDIARAELACPPLDHPGRVHRLQFSPDGSLLAAIGPTAAFLWDTRSGRKVGTLRHDMTVQEERAGRDLRVVFNPAGTTLLTTWGRGSFRLWKVDGRPLGPPIPAGEIHDACFAFSPDGSLVIVGHDDGTAQVWDVATSRPLGPPSVQPRGIVAVAFRPDGRSFVTVSDEGTVRRWPVPEPIEGDLDRLDRAIVLMTGLRMDQSPAVASLTREDWEKLRHDWIRVEGPVDWRVGSSLSDREWHDARARDAEQADRHFTALFHLDRLIAAEPREWRWLARRAQVFAEASRWAESQADYRRLGELVGPALRRAWMLHQARSSFQRRRPELARWYFDLIIQEKPDDPNVLREIINLPSP